MPKTSRQNGTLKLSNSQSTDTSHTGYQPIKSPTLNADNIVLGNTISSTGTFAIDDITDKNRGTTITTNIANDMIIGKTGTGKLHQDKGSIINISGTLIAGEQSQSQDNLLQLGTPDENTHWGGTGVTANTIILADKGLVTANIYNSMLEATQSLTLANQKDAVATANIDGNAIASLRANTMSVGQAGTATINLENGNVSAKTIHLGTQKTGVGIINIKGGNKNHASIYADTLIIGDMGKGEINSSDFYHDDSWGITAHIKKTIIGNQADGQGRLDIQSSVFETDELIVGNEGVAKLNITNKGIFSVGNITRNPKATTSVFFDDGTIDINRS